MTEESRKREKGKELISESRRRGVKGSRREER